MNRMLLRIVLLSLCWHSGSVFAAPIAYVGVRPIIYMALSQAMPNDTAMKQSIASLYYLFPDKTAVLKAEKARVAALFKKKFGQDITSIVTPIAEETLEETAKEALKDQFDQRDQLRLKNDKAAAQVMFAQAIQSAVAQQVKEDKDQISIMTPQITVLEKQNSERAKALAQFDQRAFGPAADEQFASALEGMVASQKSDNVTLQEDINTADRQHANDAAILQRFIDASKSLNTLYEQNENLMASDDLVMYEKNKQELKAALARYKKAAASLGMGAEDFLVGLVENLVS